MLQTVKTPKVKKVRNKRFDSDAVFYLTKVEMKIFFETVARGERIVKGKLVKSKPKHIQRDFLMFKIIYFHGLRREECANLKVKDYQLDKNKPGFGKVFIKAVKGGISGNELIHPLEMDLVKDYLTNREVDSEYLFFGQKSSKTGKLTADHIYIIYKSYALAAKLPIEKCHVHCLRHSLAVKMADSKYTAEDVRVRLRQKDIKSTHKYFVITEERKESLEAEVNALID